MTTTFIEERIVDNAIIANKEGDIIWNALQFDDPVVLKKEEDGTLHLFSFKTGKLIVAPYKPSEYAHDVYCPHCGKGLGR